MKPCYCFLSTFKLWNETNEHDLLMLELEFLNGYIVTEILREGLFYDLLLRIWL